jgi:hypothetical protein
MKRPWLIVIGGLVLALLAYTAAYFAGSAASCCMTRSPAPELAWLQKEFRLSDPEFNRVQELHEAYMSNCAERCRLIDAKNAELQKLLGETNSVTPQIETTLRDAAQLRADCQKAMLQHFFEVSRTMPPEQGRRYLAWVTARTLGSPHSAMTSGSSDAPHEHHHE